MSKTTPFLELSDCLFRGASARTELGLFFAFTQPAVDARNPSTGELVRGFIRARRVAVFAPGAATLAVLPAEARAASADDVLRFLRRQLARDLVPEHRHVAEALEVPTAAGVELALGPIADTVLAELRLKGRATVRGFGAFAPKKVGEAVTVGFEPGRDFAERVNREEP